jgi:hypothetical protein
MKQLFVVSSNNYFDAVDNVPLAPGNDKRPDPKQPS